MSTTVTQNVTITVDAETAEKASTFLLARISESVVAIRSDSDPEIKAYLRQQVRMAQSLVEGLEEVTGKRDEIGHAIISQMYEMLH
ncbi:hypothetical protein SEA_GUEY18_80 [Gordonia phage Guey18]|nr:hypothetical protein SEA_GUEY18_80 [Gordonia phage Guey18]